MNNYSDIKEAQAQMRKYHAGGATGVLVSGVVWLLCAIASTLYPPKQTMWVLLIGGALIHPVSIFLGKLMGIKEKKPSGNLMAQLAMEGTLFMLFCIPLAYALASQQVPWFYLGMMLIIGGRYLTFGTIYGNKMYWLLGFTLALACFILFQNSTSVLVIALTTGIIEICFGFVILFNYKKSL